MGGPYSSMNLDGTAVDEDKQRSCEAQREAAPLWLASGTITFQRDTPLVARAAVRGRRGRGVRAAPCRDGPPPWGAGEIAIEQRTRRPAEPMGTPCKALTPRADGVRQPAALSGILRQSDPCSDRCSRSDVEIGAWIGLSDRVIDRVMAVAPSPQLPFRSRAAPSSWRPYWRAQPHHPFQLELVHARRVVWSERLHTYSAGDAHASPALSP